MKFIFALLLGLASPVIAATELTVLTLNVYAKPDPTESRYTTERMEKICDTLKAGPWQVVMLQEVWTTGHRKRFASCGFPYVMDLQRTGGDGAESSLESGLLILSKFPLKNKERLVLSRPRFNWTSVSHGETLVWKSVYLALATLPDGKQVWLANTHLTANYCKTTDYATCDSYDVERHQQGVEASDFLKKRTKLKALIFGGDFNSGPHPFRADRLWKTWPELAPGLRQAAFDPVATCTACGSNSFKATDTGKIDHVYVSADLVARSGLVVLDQTFASRDDGKATHLSDHYGWQTVLQVTP